MGRQKKNLVLRRAQLLTPKQIICFNIRLKSRQKWNRFAGVRRTEPVCEQNWEVLSFSLDST